MESKLQCHTAATCAAEHDVEQLLHPIQEEPSRKWADVFTRLTQELSSGGLSGTKTPQLIGGGLSETKTLVVLSETLENRTLL
ncbi:unnamed protein product [Arctogadus glacialis]